MSESLAPILQHTRSNTLRVQLLAGTQDPSCVQGTTDKWRIRQRAQKGSVAYRRITDIVIIDPVCHCTPAHAPLLPLFLTFLRHMQPLLSLVTAHSAAYLCHDDSDGRLADQHRLAAHVWPSDDCCPGSVPTEVQAVGHCCAIKGQVQLGVLALLDVQLLRLSLINKLRWLVVGVKE